MNRNRKLHYNRWYEITLTDQSVKIVKGQQSISAIKKEYKNRIRSIRRISIDQWQENQNGRYVAFMDLEYNTGEQSGYPTEIISVGVVIADRKNMHVHETYYSLVHPKINTVLNPYCKELTKLKQTEIDFARTFKDVFTEVFALYRKWGICQTYVYGNADFRVLKSNIALNETESEFDFMAEGMKDVSAELFRTLFGKEGCISLEKLGRILNVEAEGELHNALTDAKLLWKCCKSVKNKEIPGDRLSQAKDELIIREFYLKSRRFDDICLGFPRKKKNEAYVLIEQLLHSVQTENLKEKGKLLALCDDLLLAVGEKPKYSKEFFKWI